MKQKRPPKNVLKFKVPQKAVPANLPSAEWLKELQETLKKQSEAAIALIKLTADAAQRIHRYTRHATLATELFTDEELRTGWVDYATAIKLISDEPVRSRAEENFKWLGQKYTDLKNEEAMQDPDVKRGWGLPYDLNDFYECFLYENERGYPGEAISTEDVLCWREHYQELAKKSFDTIHRRFSRKDRQKRGAKRQIAARGKRHQRKKVE
jgi:hypothetical protein